ncbi:hypothetical protein [Mucilaginibacter sp. SP1R1]|uniref:hypothetical protein n=1 Tax=Mucilaginibacter sp. SP1R1 TaxID=2723091 RepID=UPI001614F722|nr:hypothetical protein [Mucilaginibacter sp. SP1R1]MBB6149492.1 hypothetical protein [Mucilaginibacter sp. SP1R1]
MQQINKYILKKAMEAGICEPWADMITDTESVDGLLKMYVKGIDFCLAKNFPSNADLLRLGRDRLSNYGIYIDKGITGAPGDFVVLLGGCRANLHIDGFSANQLFVKHTTTANINVAGNAFVMIDCFDNAVLNVTASGNSKVVVNVYKYAQVTNESKDGAIIKIVHKNKSTY